MLSLPHRLHFTGKSLISVVGSNHKIVCLPHIGQSRRLRLLCTSSACGWDSIAFCKKVSPRL